MQKSEFLKKLSSVVADIKFNSTMTHGELWKKSIKSGRKAGFKVGPNDDLRQNKLLSAIMEIPCTDVSTPSGVLMVMALYEEAWEEYFAKVVKERSGFTGN